MRRGLALALFLWGCGSPPLATRQAPGGMAGLHVAAGRLENGAGEPVQLHGVDRSGTEYACIQGTGIFDGPSDQASVDAMLAWRVNAARVPLNEDCWLGINGVDPLYGGDAYREAVEDYVDLLTQNGLAVILDLHWSAPGTEPAAGQLPMADSDHSVQFWSEVASAFAGNGAVLFDLFNEPTIADWDCWLEGGACARDGWGDAYSTPGMAGLLAAVRGAGAPNVVLLGGLGWASDLTGWVAAVERLPSLANVAASWHVYDFNGQSGCPSSYNGHSGTCASPEETLRNAGVEAVLAAGFPVVTSETGISAYGPSSAAPFSDAQLGDLEGWYDGLLGALDGRGQSYLAWDWTTSCSPGLLRDYGGTPSPYFGVVYQTHLAGLAAAPPPAVYRGPPGG